ncbi:hypothetical protein MSPP1_003489 [Malassezia sp. CBS 17886]|nr:hypothetical protein MSPP1_003489 [Malassezia sp. CBS 17886]
MAEEVPADRRSTPDALAPIFKRRNRRGAAKVVRAPSQDLDPDGGAGRGGLQTPSPVSSGGIQELVEMRAILRRPAGIELGALNTGGARGKEGGENAVAGHAGDAHGARGEALATRLVRGDHFQGEQSASDTDRFMVEYIESHMRKRPADSDGERHGAHAENFDADLFRVAEKYRQLQEEARAEGRLPRGLPDGEAADDEGNSTLSAAMLSSIPEVDLGVAARLQNIEDTEKAKHALYVERRRSAGGVDTDDDYSSMPARFFRADQWRATSHDSEPSLEQERRAAQRERAVQEENPGPGEQAARGVRARASPSPMRREYASDEKVLSRFKKRQRRMR